VSEAPRYPAGLLLAGRRVVVVGGGPVAQRRVAGLLEARADVEVISPQVTAGLLSLAETGRIRWSPRPYSAGDLAGAWYAVAATDDPAVNAAVAGEAEAARVFCSRADHAAGASAHTPAVGRHGDLTVAVLGGGDPRRAAGVRDAILAGLGSGTLPDRRFRTVHPGVVLVGGGPGDPELITVRGRLALAQADVVVVDRLAPQALLDELPPDVQVVDVSKIPYGRSASQQAINETLVEHARAGRRVVRLKGGDPFVFGRGMEEVLACLAAGVPVEVVPGVTSAIGVPALTGVPVTHRGVAHEFVVVSGHLPPGHPDSLVDWTALGRLRGTLVLLMAGKQLPAIAAELLAHGRPASTPVAVITEGSRPDQQVRRCQLADLVALDPVTAPAVVVIGNVVAVRDPGSDTAALRTPETGRSD